ncbi:MAG: glycosyltransferase [Chthoniobacteraceae bacterium]
MIAVSHPTGNEFVRALLVRLEKRNLLGRFFTTVNAPGGRGLSFLPGPIREQAGRRTFDIPRARIATRPVREMARLFAKAAGFSSLTLHESGWASLDAVYADLDHAAASWIENNAAEMSAVHCYEDGAVETFREAARHGIRCSYELPIAYWKTVHAILDEEAQRLPAWEPTLFSTRDSTKKLERKTEEINLADVVICPSRFVHDSLPEEIRSTKKCVVANFGSPACLPDARHVHARAGKKLRVLFAGAMSQRKGLADLFEAMKLLDRTDVELVVMGSPVLPMDFYRQQFSNFIHEPPRPHGAVMQLMQTCDLLALPSLVEGRALVQQEALACGLPLIVTANAGGADLVEEGETGFLVPVRAPGKIAEKIGWYADHRDSLPALRDAARRKAAEYTWEAYAETIISAGGFEE